MDLTGKQFGQYRIVRLLGRGGMGEVYEGEHTTLGRSYALKLLPPEFASHPDALARFRREAQVMAKLEHPHIVRVDDFGETAGRYWLRMELVKGVESKPESGKQKIEIKKERCITLGDYAAQRGGQIEPAEFAVILKQMLEALAFAHDAGVVHRDLKPGNILLDRDAQGRLLVKISDFGLARVVGDEFLRSQIQLSVSRSLSLGGEKTLGRELSVGEQATLQPGEGASSRALVGTWEYMAPEQRRGETADARSDVYAVGLMCYRLLTGKGLGLKLPSELVSGLAPEWDLFITRALEQDPAARHASGREMLAEAGPVFRTMQGVERGVTADTQKQVKEEPSWVDEGIRDDEEARREERRAKFAATWHRCQLFLLSPRGVTIMVLLVLAGAAAYYGIPAYRQHVREARVDPQQAGMAHPKTKPFVNSLGMKFVSVPGTEVLFGIWDVRMQDYRAYAATNTEVDNAWRDHHGIPRYAQGETYPVVNVNWDDARAFCRWLTSKERREGLIRENQSYRLPMDAEWSVAVGLNEDSGLPPAKKDGKTPGAYPWGTGWPPPNGAGNYDDGSKEAIAGFHDGYELTSPVGSFRANRYGLYDMGGNVWQWCEDLYDVQSSFRVLRGASYYSHETYLLLSSHRKGETGSGILGRIADCGFRCVLEGVPDN